MSEGHDISCPCLCVEYFLSRPVGDEAAAEHKLLGSADFVQASDGQLTSLQAVLVTVTNAPEVPLPGDYNNNGIVDAADYVLWRNGGPLQNDPTAGVQPDDYNVWRANFGRTAGAGSHSDQTPLGAGSEFDKTESAASQRHNELRTLLDIPRLRREDEAVERRDIHRPVHRGAFAASGSRDDALVAAIRLGFVADQQKTQRGYVAVGGPLPDIACDGDVCPSPHSWRG